MNIGELARRSKVPRDTLRFYFKQGLLPAPARRSNGYQVFGEAHLMALQQIAVFKALGFTLSEIRDVLQPGRPMASCAELPRRLQQQIGKVGEALAQLQRHHAGLLRVQAACQGSCSPGTQVGSPAEPPGAQ